MTRAVWSTTLPAKPSLGLQKPRVPSGEQTHVVQLCVLIESFQHSEFDSHDFISCVFWIVRIARLPSSPLHLSTACGLPLLAPSSSSPPFGLSPDKDEGRDNRLTASPERKFEKVDRQAYGLLGVRHCAIHWEAFEKCAKGTGLSRVLCCFD
jgi:hypothetical protein